MIVYLEDEAKNRVAYVITTGRSFKDGYNVDTGINIKYYSKLLLNTPEEKQRLLIGRINKLANYKIYFWSKYAGTIRNIKTKTLDKEVLRFLRSFEEFNLKTNVVFLEGLTDELI